MLVQTAVIPAAGWGTRLLPLTKAIPKVMLPVGHKPAVQYVVEEIARSGIGRIVFVIGKGGEIIQDHFTPSDSLIRHLEEKKEKDLVDLLRYENLGLEFHYVRQEIPKGLGNAILQAREMVEGEYFVVALGDAILELPPEDSVIRSLVQVQKERNASAVLAVEEKDARFLSHYGVIIPVPGQKGEALDLEGVVEKPAPGKAPSSYAIAARYVFTPDIFPALDQGGPDPERGWELTDAINFLCQKGKRVCAFILKKNQVRHDVGNYSGYCDVFSRFSHR
jgi:UTP--glucose-1-phosphate uridylyltransferase